MVSVCESMLVISPLYHSSTSESSSLSLCCSCWLLWIATALSVQILSSSFPFHLDKLVEFAEPVVGLEESVALRPLSFF